MNEETNRDAQILLLLLILAIIVAVGFCMKPGQWETQETMIMDWKQGLWALGIAAGIFILTRITNAWKKIGQTKQKSQQRTENER